LGADCFAPLAAARASLKPAVMSRWWLVLCAPHANRQTRHDQTDGDGDLAQNMQDYHLNHSKRTVLVHRMI
jgi:hypothetical protein